MGWNEFVVLKTFESEAEARVVESLLTAQGFVVELHGTHASVYTSVRASQKGVGLRLMIRERDLEAAQEALNAARPIEEED